MGQHGLLPGCTAPEAFQVDFHSFVLNALCTKKWTESEAEIMFSGKHNGSYFMIKIESQEGGRVAIHLHCFDRDYILVTVNTHSQDPQWLNVNKFLGQ